MSSIYVFDVLSWHAKTDKVTPHLKEKEVAKYLHHYAYQVAILSMSKPIAR